MMTTAQRNKLDAARWRKLVAIIEASATKVGTIGMDNDHREMIVSKASFGQTDTATVTIRPTGE